MSDVNELIREALEFDPLAQAEQWLGESYKSSEEAAGLGLLLMQHNMQHLNNLLSLNDDSTLYNKLADYMRIVKSIGFELIYEEPLVITDYKGKVRNETLYVMWRNGVLLVFDSYHTDDMNSGNFYYNWIPNKDCDNPYKYTSSGRWDGTEEQKKDRNNFNWREWVWVGNHDCREAIKFRISELENHGTLLSQWKYPNDFLQINSSQEYKKDCTPKESILDYARLDKLRHARIAKFPEHVKKAILCE